MTKVVEFDKKIDSTENTWADDEWARPLWAQSHMTDGKSFDDLLIKA